MIEIAWRLAAVAGLLFALLMAVLHVGKGPK